MVRKILNRKKLNPLIPVFTGVKRMDQTKIQLFKYNSDECDEYPEYSVVDFQGWPADNYIYWLNIHGIHEDELIKKICDSLGVQPLSIQDILDINQRPKFQDFDNYWFFSLKSILPSDNSDIESEQLSFILGRNYLVSFQEREADYFDHVRYRIRNKVGKARDRGPDFLLYLLLEAILDNYFRTVGDIEAKIEDLKISNIDIDPSPEVLKTIENYKRQIHHIKKTIVPIRDFIIKTDLEQADFVEAIHTQYFMELKDMCLTLVDDCEQMEVRLESNINMFFSVQGHRMNQVMKTLTVVATIFIPLTFIAGIYGMNFTNMPELGWKWGYFVVWGIMLGVFVGMLIYFRKKKWF